MPDKAKRMKIGYLTFGRDELSYGLALCLSRCQGHEVFRITPKTARQADVLVFSLFWWEHPFLLANFLRQAGLRKGQNGCPRIVVGGFNTFNPMPALAYADAVVVGDGEDATNNVIEGDYTSANVLTENKDSVTYGQCELRPFCHETNKIARIEVARGCRHRCKFCAVAHHKTYRELPVDEVREALQQTNLKRVSCFAPEPTLHSDDDEISSLCHVMGKSRQDSDVRLDRLGHRVDSVPRVGIEGLSEKLRKSVRKGYSNDQIIDGVKQAIADGRKGMFMYMILDLPGEQAEDWEEFRGLLEHVSELPGADGFLLKPSPSVFLPTPHTPMAEHAIHWDRPYAKMWEEFFGRGEARKWGVLMAERSRVFGPESRLLSMLATRCNAAEFKRCESLLQKNKAIGYGKNGMRVNDKRKLRKVIEAIVGIDKLTGEAESGPWDIVKMGNTT